MNNAMKSTFKYVIETSVESDLHLFGKYFPRNNNNKKAQDIKLSYWKYLVQLEF